MAPAATLPRALRLAVGGLVAQAVLSLHLPAAGGQSGDREGQPGQPGQRRVYRHLHIPKTAGLSFVRDAHELLNASGLLMESAEGCFPWADSAPGGGGAMVLLRRPLAHVLSMHSFCAAFREYRQDAALAGQAALPGFEDWLAEWDRRTQAQGAWGGDFTPPAAARDERGVEGRVRDWRISSWGAPPFSAVATTLNESDWPHLDGGGTIWHQTKMPYACYSPVNPQVHRMACEAPQVYPRGGPDTALAIRNMRKAWFVGIVEHYQSSLCLLEFKLLGRVPRGCNCSSPGEWGSFKYHTENVQDPPVPPGALDSKHLVDGDTALYEAAWARFVSDAREVEARLGTRILCNETLPAPEPRVVP